MILGLLTCHHYSTVSSNSISSFTNTHNKSDHVQTSLGMFRQVWRSLDLLEVIIELVLEFDADLLNSDDKSGIQESFYTALEGEVGR